MLTKDSITKLLKEADELLSRGDVVQASEKYYKAAEESIKILSLKNNVSVVRRVKSLNHWTSKLYFEAVSELEKFYSSISSLWLSAWILHIEGFHEVNLSQDQVRLLREDVIRLVNLALV
ncbi:hypothetical protein SUSAZ_10075 [Sulfolobus acidocaldarius SUSAZ]|nr:hypothetical protein SUSAZ_10075 [Sulfolobus acidocaldarius SUSAZ]